MPPQSVIFSVDMVNAILISFILDATGLPVPSVLIETRTSPRPIDASPYVTILWRDQDLLPQFDSPFVQPLGESEGLEDQKNEAWCSVRITVRGNNAYNMASELRYELDRGQRAFELWNMLGFAGVSSVTDLSASYGGKVQQRAFIDLNFYAAFGRRYDMSWFTSVPWIINNLSTLIPH